MSPHLQAWLSVLQADAEQIGALLGQGRVAREQRQTTRARLWQAFALLEQAGQGQAVEPVALTDLRADLEALRRSVGDGWPAGILPLQQVWIRKPLPPRLTLPACARATHRLVRLVEGHFAAAVALTPQRLDWFDRRCGQADPTHVAQVRQPDDAKTSRLSTSEMALLVKKGPSRFS